MTEENDKTYLSPDVSMWPNDEHGSYHIEISLPGVEKENIKLKMHGDSFLIKGESEDTIYIGSYAVCCPVNAVQAKATYNNGLLKVDVPFKEQEYHNVEVNIE